MFIAAVPANNQQVVLFLTHHSFRWKSRASHFPSYTCSIISHMNKSILVRKPFSNITVNSYSYSNIHTFMERLCCSNILFPCCCKFWVARVCYVPAGTPFFPYCFGPGTGARSFLCNRSTSFLWCIVSTSIVLFFWALNLTLLSCDPFLICDTVIESSFSLLM